MRTLTLGLLALLLVPAAAAQKTCLSGDCENGQGTARYGLADGEHFRYTGPFVNGEPHGSGSAVSSNGETYVGAFRNGLMHGQGTYTWPDGRVYQGAHEDGVISGHGTFTTTSGWTYEGTFVDGSQEGVHLATHTSGQQERVRWRGGEFVEVVERLRDASGGAAGTDLVLGRTVSGTITSSDPSAPLTAGDDRRPADAYTLTLAAGQEATVRMESGDFDTYLKVVRDGQFIARNDDFEGSRAVSQVAFTAASAGTYTVYAGTFSEAGRGAYTVRASGRGGPTGTAPGGDEPAGPPLTAATYCALNGTALREFEARYDPGSGRYYAPDGRLVSEFSSYESWVLEMGRYAGDKPWYIDNAPIEVGGASYVKFGLPRVLGVSEVSFLAEAGGAAVFAEAGASGTPEIVYVAVQPGCEFQPYQLDLTSRPNGIRDPEPTVLSLDGNAVSTTITSDDLRVPLMLTGDLRAADAYTLALSAGQEVTVRMESTAFDPYLKVVRDGEDVVRNDDFEGSRAVSQVTFTAASAGTYTVYAGAFSASGAGAYTVRGSVGSGRAPASGPADETVVQGALTDGDPLVPIPLSDELRRADAYPVRVEAGRTLVVEMTSSAFDTYLRLERDGARVDYNDDDGSTSRSSVRYTADRSGTVTVYAGAFSETGRGAYTLRYHVE